MKFFSAIGCLALGTLYQGTISASQEEESFKTLSKAMEKMKLDIDSLNTKVKNGEKEKLIMNQDMQEMKMKMIDIEKENQEMKEEIKMLQTEMEFMGNQGHGNN